MYGNCRFGEKCRFKHLMRSVGLRETAHNKPIYCVAVGIAPPIGDTPVGSYEIFTGGGDGNVKRWVAMPENPLPPPSSPPASGDLVKPLPVVKFKMRLDATTKFENPVTSILLAADCLFCGLRNGHIQGFHRPTGAAFHLQGHTRDVQALILVDGILISGDYNGALSFWKPTLQPDGSPSFILVQTLQMPGGIKCLKDVIASQLNAQGMPIKNLWVGCLSQVVVLDLITMQTVYSHTLSLDSEPGETSRDACVELIIFANNVLCGCSSGNILCCSIDGPQVQWFADAGKGGITSMTGVLARRGPQLVLGDRHGYFNFVDLPSMSQAESFMPHSEGGSIRLQSAPPSQPNMPSWFCSVAEDGALAMWQLV